MIRARVRSACAATITLNMSENQLSRIQLRSGAEVKVVDRVASRRKSSRGRNSGFQLNERGENSSETAKRKIATAQVCAACLMVCGASAQVSSRQVKTAKSSQRATPVFTFEFVIRRFA